MCTGAFATASMGILDGRIATPHWRHPTRLQSLFPAITVQPDAIFVKSGNVFTSAGVSAGVDLALALVEEDHGPVLTREIARELV